QGQPSPVGVPGELFIGGVQVGLGYWRSPHLTAERFIPDAFSDSPGARLYRTGDLARWLPDGTLEYLGRSDFQVKLRGFRIELGEIENALLAHPSVRDAIVTVREDVAGDARLVAYVTGNTEPLPQAQLRAHLEPRLPEYMVPSVFMHLEAMPLTPSGKADRKALPAPERLATTREYAAPRTPTEQLLASLFASVLRIERISVTDSFFELGGHSLLATQLVSRVRQSFGVELPVRALFEASTVAQLATRIESARQERHGLQLPPLAPVPRTGELPLSFAQQRLWFLDKLQPDSPFYNIPSALQLEGALDTEALTRALQELVRRHESLRTSFHTREDGEPVQRIHPDATLSVSVVDLGHLPEQAREAEAQKLATLEIQKPFDLTHAPLLRASLLRLSEQRHVLLVTVHHIVSDGWSSGIFGREVGELYAAFSRGLPSPLAPLSLQYADYAAWQRGWLRDDVLAQQVAWWREHLAGAPHALELPTDRPRPAVQSAHGANLPVRLGAELTTALRTLCQREGVTPFMVLLSAFNVLLARYSGQDDIVVGSPIANRQRAELEGIIGFFVNTLALRTRTRMDMTFRELLAQVRESTLAAYEHQDVPFEKLVEELQPQRDLSRSPLFQAMLGLQTARAEATPAGAPTSLEVDSGTAKFDLSLLLVDTGDDIHGLLEFNTDLFDRSTARRMGEHLTRLLTSAVSDASQSLARLPLLSTHERQQLLTEWNDTAHAPHVPVAIHHPVEVQAARTPEAIAVSDGTTALTYAQLDARANQLAHVLRQHGVLAGATVGTCLEKSLDMAVAVLATLKAGAAYLPLDPNYPAERLAFMLEDSGTRVVLSHSSLRDSLPVSSSVRNLLLDVEAEVITAKPTHALTVALSPDAPAYVIYTSGSTGRPKGVALPHRALSNLFTWQLRQSRKPQATTLQFASLSFDVSCQELFSTWWAGGTLVLPTGGLRQDVPALLDFVQTQGVERLFLPFVALQAIADAVAHGATLPVSLREVVTAGEQLQVTPALVALFERLPGCVLENQYGPSETHVVSAHRLQGAPASWPRLPSIGAPLPHTQLFVLDVLGQPTPIGVPGELHIGGEHLALGYPGRPELTAEKFVPHPFSEAPGARLYRTGDSARWKADGTVEFLGRLDGQVKLRGFRVELGEVEAAMRALPGIRDAAAVVREDVPGDKRLVGYVVPTEESGAALTPNALRSALLGQLPEYMVPSVFLTLEALPLTPSGKIARRLLPTPDAESLRGDATFIAPRTPAEEKLAELFASVLKLPRVGATDSFFALGGHSLLATQVVSRIRATFNVELPLRELFEAPTVAGLAERLEQYAAETKVPPLVPADRSRPLPLSFAQQRLWFLDKLQPDSPTFNMPIALRLEGVVDVAALRQAITELVRRHEVLRTTFQEGPVQVIHAPAPVPMPVEDLSSLTGEAREAEVQRRVLAEAKRPFDLGRGPVLRASLLRLEATQHVLMLTLHHIATDGWSMGLLVRESTELYALFVTGQPSRLPELPIQYADYAAWQRDWLRGDALEAQLSWWRTHLSGAAPQLDLPTDFPRPVVQGFQGAMVGRVLPRTLVDSIQALCRQEGSTLFMALLAGFQVVLSRYSGQEDFVLGTDIANRNRAETEGLIGFFINQLALRARLGGDPSFRELLSRVKTDTLGAYAHQDLPFEELVKDLNPGRGLGFAPLFQVKLVLQNQPDTELEVPGLTFRPLGSGTGTARLDLTLSITESAHGLSCSAEYRTDLFTAETIDGLIRHLGNVLEAATVKPSARISTLALMRQEEQQRVLVEWNDSARDFPREATAHSLFEAQARRTPEAEALRFEGESLTFAQLDSRANQLAHHLRSLGVRPEVPVALCLERSLDLVVSMLAILKAGGAWVPLDPSYPVERLSFILRDCSAPVLLTTEALADELPVSTQQLVLLDSDARFISRQPTSTPDSGAVADNLAYVIYTSGSTGTPKGTLLQHRGFSNTALAAGRRHGFSPASRVLQFASFSFDASVAEIFGALLAGSTLVLAPRERLMPGAPLRDLLRDESISAVTLTPSVLAQLNPEDFPSLSTLISAGEACPPELVSRWGSRVRLLNAYGPTEVTVCASISEPLLPGQTPSIGTPWDNVRLFILDASLRPLPVGVPGQLCIDSVGLARGYLHRADLTAERFVPNPFSNVLGARLYLTGDKARWLADGTLEFLGRLDSQVKLRGFRIELGEVEAALLLHPSVSQAVASIRTETSGDKRLVAYVVGEDIDVSVLRDFLKLRLPEHMVPSAIAQLDALPLTPNGKVDRDALPSPDASIAVPVREYVAPRTPTEIRLAALWAELLHVERVGLTDDFFELGGHSLLATQSLSRLQATFGIEVPLRELFEAPTVEKLAARVEVLVQAGTTTPRAPELTPVARTGNLPLSFAQRRLWFLDQLEPGTALYNLPAAIRLEGAVDVSALEQAFAALVRRHEALRTTFPANADGSPHQAIAEDATLNVVLVDLSTLPSEQREDEARRLALAEARKPFDLARGPLLRVTLLRLEERQHVLLLTMHHIVSDGWSTGVLVREAAELYGAAREGRTASLPTLRVQYADHAAWQHQWLGAGELERQLTYWKTQLAGANHVLALPTDRPVPPMQTQAGATHPVRLSPEVSSAVTALGQQLGATPFMVVLAAFQAFLYRVTGQDDVLVGSPVAGRNRPETEGLIGVFINTLVLRGQMSGAMSFRALVEQAREAALGALTHQDVPFEHLVEELQPARSLSHSPLFQVMFALQNTPVPSLTLPELSLTPADVDPGIAKYSLSLVLQETPAGLMGGFEYNTDLFDARTLEAMTGQFTRMLEAAVSTPDVSLAALPLLSAEERHQLLVQWNDTRSDFPRESSVFTWFQARAAQSPEAVALEWTDGTLTYRELERRALALAELLRQRNVGPEVRVGLFARRSPELVIGVLGVLAAGGVWVPLDPSSPSERLTMMLEDTTPAVVLTQRALRTSLPSTSTVLVLEDLVSADAVASSAFTAPGLASENAAYVLFTSGSTGRPKGVVVPHRALARHTAWFTKNLGLGPADRMLQKTAPGFDAVVPELLATLASGATLVLPPSSADLDMDALLSVLASQRVTVLQLVPSQLRLLVESERLERASGLRVLVSGGEALSAELARRVRVQWPQTRLANCYGPTETTVDATSWTVSGDIQGATAPIGGPIADTQVYVLDAHGQPVPVGVTGELFIGGEGVARGYIGQAAMTAERFVPDAFSSVPGARLYATGDQVRWRRDGVLEFLGRADDQVKVRGFRIELAEIESALLAHPEVREAVVLVREDRPGDRRLVGYVVAPASQDTAALRTFIAQRLPEYMVPSALRVLESLPLTSNGKVDRKALPVPEQTWFLTEDARVAPATPTEELLAGLFAQVLGVSSISTTASFFELGGHSLLATQLVSRVRSAFQVELPLRDLFESPTVQALAQRIEAAMSTGARIQRPPLTALPREGDAPRAFVQSFAQQRLWFLDQLDPGSPAYNMPIALRLEGIVDTRALERAFTEMVRRHESLRTTFRAGPEQVVHGPSPVTVPVVEVSSLDEGQVQRWVDEEARRPFDLARGPLLRAKLLRLGEQRHILLLTMHHIVSDGWSMGVLVRETAALYAAFRAGQPSPLPELSIQYADYAAWQRAWLQGEALEAQVSWWKEHLSGAPPLLELPTDFPRPARQGFGGALVSRVLPRSLVESLQALCRREGSTLFMALMAGLQAVLSRYSGQEDFVVGTGIANRHQAETEDLIGFFINQLPLRARLGGNPSFRELLSRVRKDTLGAYAHQDLPFEEVVKAVNPERNPAHAPLFQVALVLQNQPDSELKLPDLTFHLQPANTGTSRLDLTLSAAETAQGLSFGVEYRTDLFTAETVDGLIRHLGVLLEKAVERPEAPVASLSLLTEAEQRRVLVEWNDSARDFPREATAHSLFEAQARRTPEAEALRFEGTSLTFAQLDSRANQLAHHLRSLGVRPEVPVALCLERSLDLVVSMLAILKAGGAWVPLDPTYPAERLSFILRDSSAPVLLTTEALAKQLPVSAQQRVLIDSEAAKIATQPTTAPESGAVADNLAYVIYTSGSTGTPKGTLLQHRGFSNTALAAGRRHGFSPASRVLQFASFSFDASVAEIFGALLAGSTLVLAPRERLMPGAPLRDLLRDESISAVTLTPSVLAQLNPEDFPSLSTLISAGEACPPELVSRWGSRVRLLNAYGPTEVTVCASISEPLLPGQTPSIGTPWDNVRLFILDASLRPLPVGVPGQLCIDSVGLARGYLHRADLTAERFVPNPFSNTLGARLYLTGDKARWLADGTLEFLGRLDSQVKLRGFRIELGEVEAALLLHPSVSQAVASIRTETSGDKRLVAYVVGEDVDVSVLRDFLKLRLPEHMVPSAIAQLDALPLTPNGKVDRDALPALDSQTSTREYVAPRTPTEIRLAALWAELLHVERIGLTDDFFELGGHSLLATQLVSRVRATFGVELALRDLFSVPTIEALAQRVDEAILAGKSVQLPPLVPVSREGGPLPLSFAQQRLWFLDRFQPDSAFYNIPSALRLDTMVDLDALIRALQELVHRHESLRTSFHTREDGEPYQRIHPRVELSVPVVDLSRMPEAAREAEALELATAEAQKPFDLTRVPLLRTTLLKLAPEQHVLLVTVHHIVSDGWSSGILSREVGALYSAFSQGLPSPLAPLPLQYADYAAWQRGWLRDETLAAQVSWWRQSLSGVPHALELPTDRPRPPVQTSHGASFPVKLGAELSAALHALCKQEGITPFMALLTGLHVLLARYSGQDDIVVGSPIANRRQSELEDIVGFFVNTLALRARLTSGITFRTLLAQVKETTLGAYAHQDVPFEKLVEELKLERDLSRSPLFQVMLALQNTPRGERVTQVRDTDALRSVDVDSGTAKYDLSLLLGDSGQEIEGLVEFNTDLFDASTARRMGAHWVRLLQSAIANPDQSPWSLSLLSREEERQLLVEWNDTSREPHTATTMHGPVEAQVARTPDAIAITDGQRSLTYAAMDQRANQLAHHLVQHGVTPGSAVGICVDKSLDMAIAVLATLKVGAYYVALDPTYPADRLAFMLEDTRAPVVLTQSHLGGSLPSKSLARRIALDMEAVLIARQPTTSLARDVSPEANAYVIYTSGSTGIPKGIVMPHRALSYMLAWQIRQSPRPQATTLQFASLNFDVSIQELFASWWVGARVVLPTDTLRRDIPALLDFMDRQGVERLFLPFVALQAMADSVAHGATLPRALCEVITAGEQLQVNATLAAMFEKLPGCTLENQYGPSEAHVVSAYRMRGPPASWPRLPPVGSPLGHTQLYILDPLGQPAPIGVAGEVFVGGSHLAHGYLARPDITAAAFVPNPFSGIPGDRLYRTGDSARWTADGNLEFLGRIDFQVKVRGFRVELGEVESVLRTAPGVRDAAAAVREDVPGDKRLVAYVVPVPANEAPASATTAETLRTYLLKRLPEYMVPSAFVTLEALPLTPSGKLARKLLPAPDAESLRTEASFIAPRTPVEEKLAELFATVLKLARVSVTENFFELGGHSLLATQVTSRIRSTFAVELPVRELFEAPTVAALAQRVDTALRTGATTAAPPIQRVARDGKLPLSFSQQRVWFLDQLEPGSPAFNIPAALVLAGALDVEVLRRTLEAVVHRHEALRTTFRAESDGPVQVIHAPAPFVLPLTDLRDLAPEQREAEARRRAGEHALQSFDLGAGPLLRAELLVLAEREHLLLLNLHHIVSDGWSISVIVREMSTLYGDLQAGRTPSLPELPLQYADFAAWQRGWLEGAELDRQLAWWQRQLDGAPQDLELPTDRPRTHLSRPRGGVVSLAIAPAKAEAIEAFCHREGLTPFMFFLGAFQLLLSRYSGQDDISVGSPVAGRNRAELEGLVGFFLNTLVLRTKLDGDPTVRELLARVRETALGAYAHQHLPFEQLQPLRDLQQSPLFRVMFILQNTPDADVSLPGLELRPGPDEGHVAKFDMTLSMGRNTAGFTGELDYQVDLYDASTIERMTRHFLALVDVLVASPDRRLSTVTLLSDEERSRQLVTWNDTRADFPDTCVHTLFEAQVRRAPDALAASFEGSRLTYAQLDARANQLAHALRRRGVGPEVRVALSVERSLDVVVGLLGILKAGGAWVPVDPLLPRERLAFLLEDSGAAMLLTQAPLLERYPEAHRARALCLDTEQESLSRESAEAPVTGVHSGNLAYVLYTSGSTGQPKGTAVEHRSVANLVTHEARAYGIGPGERVLQFANLSFDLSVEEIFTTLTSGAALVLAPLEKVMPGAPLHALLRDEALTVISLTPAALAATPAEGLPSLKTVISGGEALPSDVVARWAPGRRFLNTYGPTEATVVATLAEVVAEEGRAPSIGRPLANVRVHVLDARGEPVPVGVKGELYLGGVGVARGYVGRAALTAERFIPDSFSEVPGARLYRTGDVVRWRDDGSLEFVGRVDAQVKVRGFRIELGEVEAALARHPAVREAVVIAREDGPGGKRLVGYAVARDGVPTDGATLRTALKDVLPEYMVPAAVLVLDALPLTANGKVDRKALPAPDMSTVSGRPDFVGPRTPTEARLGAIWCAVLEVERVGIHDNFFELGGHSLMATQAISRMRAVFGVELPLRDLFDTPTLEALAQRVDLAVQQGQGLEIPALVPVPRTGHQPVSFAQQRLWFLDQLEPNSAFYNIPATVRLEGALDVEAMGRAINELLRRHESLRTSIQNNGGQPIQVVHPHEPSRLDVLDLSALEPTAREAEARRAAIEETQKPFNLADRSLLRVRLLKLGAEDHVLLMSMHHIVSDGWSMGLLVNELASAYASFSKGLPLTLPELPLQYVDYSAWQRGWLKGDVLDKQVAWWSKHLAGAPPALELPSDFPRPPVSTFRGDMVGFTMPRELQDAVQTLARREGATTFMVLLAAFQTMLARYSGQDDISIGSPIAGRRHSDLEKLIGFFANTLVLRTQLSEHLTFRELLGRVRETTLDAYAHQDVPFEKLVEELQPERSLNRTPLFQVLFVLQNVYKENYDTGDLRMSPMEATSGTSKFDLTLSVFESSHGLTGYLEYSSDLFTRQTAERMVGALQRLLQGAVSQPDQTLGRLPLLSEAERRQVVEDFNAAVDPTYVPGLMHQWVEAQVARTPERVAVTDGAESLTYAQLDARANQLAHHLRALGVSVNSTVGLCMERASLDMPVAVLATLKAGAAFLPLDPSYPADRLALMLEDTGAPVVLAHSALVSALPPGLTARIVRIEEETAVASRPTHRPDVDMSPETNCYFVYTSGSTGRPKGIVMSHRAVGNMMWWLMKRAVKPDATTLQFASLNFDVSFQELFGTWCLGGKVLLINGSLRQDPPAMLRYMREHRVERLFLPFVALQAMCDAALTEKELPPLGEIVTAGEQLQVTPALLAFFDRLPECTLENQYGPSEAHVVTAWRAPKDRKQWPALPPVGSPLTNMQIYVLDSHGAPCPIGVAGEVYVGGANVAHGYHGRPDLTADRFLPHFMGGKAGARLYRTGDKARWLADGNLEFLGRLDSQVKLRGFRIELGEVEVALRALPHVRDAVAIVREDVPGDRRLVGYVVLPPDAPWSTEEARQVLREKVPEYMVPSIFMRLESLPLMPTGKVARGGLPQPDEESLRGTTPFAAPRTPLEELLANAFAEVLRTPRVSVTDNFFSLGGHSLLATQVVSRVRVALGVELPLRALFEAPTVESLALLLQRAQAQEARPKARPATPAWSPLVTLRAGTDPRRVLHVIHDLDGRVERYAELARHAPEGFGVVGIQARGLEEGRAPLESVEAMATLYVEALRGAMPQGPYRLAGPGLGGLIAWEMAQQLQREGHAVELLLVEPLPAEPDASTAATTAGAQAALFARALATQAGIDAPVFPAALTSGKDAEPLLALMHEQGAKTGLLPEDLSLAELRTRFKVFASHLRAARRYLPEPYEGPVHLLRAADVPERDEDALDGGWGELAEGGLTMMETSGDAVALLHAPAVTEWVKRWVDLGGSGE
ncbi:amino acid adenylation domain-containing protein, partial [Myxococcus fulvus]